MAQNFLSCDRDQDLLLPPSLRDWLPDDHLAWFVLDAVDEIDLSAFSAAYREDGWGRAAFEPQMMVALLLAEAAEADASDDERLGEARGDELPAELADARLRRERLRRCKEELERAQADEEAAYQANLAWRAAWEAQHGRRLAGRRPTPPDPAALAERKINTTDPDTGLMKRAGGKSVQGYNTQVVASPEQVILAAEVTQSHNDADQLAPMVAHAAETLREAGIE